MSAEAFLNKINDVLNLMSLPSNNRIPLPRLEFSDTTNITYNFETKKHMLLNGSELREFNVNGGDLIELIKDINYYSMLIILNKTWKTLIK